MLSGRTVGIFNAYLFYLKSMFYVSMMLDVRFALHRHGKSGEGRQGNVAPSNHTSKPIGKSKICRKLQPDHKNEQSKRSVSSLTPYIDARHMRNRNKDRQRAGALSGARPRVQHAFVPLPKTLRRWQSAALFKDRDDNMRHLCKRHRVYACTALPFLHTHTQNIMQPIVNNNHEKHHCVAGSL